MLLKKGIFIYLVFILFLAFAQNSFAWTYGDSCSDANNWMLCESLPGCVSSAVAGGCVGAAKECEEYENNIDGACDNQLGCTWKVMGDPCRLKEGATCSDFDSKELECGNYGGDCSYTAATYKCVGETGCSGLGSESSCTSTTDTISCNWMTDVSSSCDGSTIDCSVWNDDSSTCVDRDACDYTSPSDSDEIAYCLTEDQAMDNSLTLSYIENHDETFTSPATPCYVLGSNDCDNQEGCSWDGEMSGGSETSEPVSTVGSCVTSFDPSTDCYMDFENCENNPFCEIDYIDEASDCVSKDLNSYYCNELYYFDGTCSSGCVFINGDCKTILDACPEMDAADCVRYPSYCSLNNDEVGYGSETDDSNSLCSGTVEASNCWQNPFYLDEDLMGSSAICSMKVGAIDPYVGWDLEAIGKSFSLFFDSMEIGCNYPDDPIWPEIYYCKDSLGDGFIKINPDSNVIFINPSVDSSEIGIEFFKAVDEESLETLRSDYYHNYGVIDSSNQDVFFNYEVLEEGGNEVRTIDCGDEASVNRLSVSVCKNEGEHFVEKSWGDRTDLYAWDEGADYYCREDDAYSFFYDEDDDICMNCLYLGWGGSKGSYSKGVWNSELGGMDYNPPNYEYEFENSPITGNSYYSYSFEPGNNVGTCCGDDLSDDPDWAKNFCYGCYAGEDQPDGAGLNSPRMWADSLVSQSSLDITDIQSYNLCCGDDFFDCGFVFSDDSSDDRLCWKWEDSFDSDSQGDYPITPSEDLNGNRGSYDYQWFVTKPSDMDQNYVTVKCQDRNGNEYYNNPVFSYNSEWYACDKTSFSKLNIDGSSIKGIDNVFVKDIANPFGVGNEENIFCSHSEFSGDEDFAFVNGQSGASSKINPDILECSNANTNDYSPYYKSDGSEHMFGIRYGSENLIYAPYSGIEGVNNDPVWGKVSLFDFLPSKISSSEAIFPHVSSPDSASYFVGEEGGGLALTYDDNILLMSRGEISVYKLEDLFEFNSDSGIFEKILSLTELKGNYFKMDGTQIDNKLYAFGTAQKTNGEIIFFTTSQLDEGQLDIFESTNSLTDIFEACSFEDSIPSARDIEFMLTYNINSFQTLFPRIEMHLKDGRVFVIESNASEDSIECRGEYSDLVKSFDTFSKEKNVDQKPSFIGSPSAGVVIDTLFSDSLPSAENFFLFPKTQGLYFFKENEVSILYSAPLVCSGDEWVRDIDDSGSETICQELGGHWDSWEGLCCGEPEDAFENYFLKTDHGVSGVCYRGEWQDAANREAARFLKNPFGDSSNEYKGILIEEGGLHSCAHNYDDYGSYVDSSLAMSLSKPYGGSYNLLEDSEFGVGWGIESNPGKIIIDFNNNPNGKIINFPLRMLKPNTNYNFRFDFKALGEISLSSNMIVSYHIIDLSGGGTNFGLNNIHGDESSYSLVSGKEDNAVFSFRTPEENYFDFSKYSHNLVISFDSNSDDEYLVTLSNAVLSSNDFFSSIKDYGDSHDRTDYSSAEPLIEFDHNYCDIIREDYQDVRYCSFKETWETIPESWLTEIGSIREDVVLKSIKQDDWYDLAGGILVSPGVQVAGCCLETECWDGDVCVESSEDESRPRLYPNESSLSGYRCLLNEDGIADWFWAEPKKNCEGNGEKYGYCIEDSQCLVDYLGNYSSNDNPEKFSLSDMNSGSGRNMNPMCIDDGQYILDWYCNDGEWISRTSLLIDELLDYAPSDYVLYCDSPLNVLNVMDAPLGAVIPSLASGCQSIPLEGEILASFYVDGSYVQSLANDVCYPLKRYRGQKEGEKYNLLNSVCSLSWMDGEEQKTIVGTSLNQPLSSDGSFSYPFGDLIGHASGSGSAGEYNVEYDSNNEIVLFSTESFPSKSSVSFISTFFNSFKDWIENFFSSDSVGFEIENSDYLRNLNYRSYYISGREEKIFQSILGKTYSGVYAEPNPLYYDLIVQQPENTPLCSAVYNFTSSRNLPSVYCTNYDGSLVVYSQSIDAKHSGAESLWTSLSAKLRIGR